MNVLGIETSCDETAAAVVDASGVRSDVIWSQEIHQQFGGVVPELASRAHIEKVVSCTRSALHQAAIEKPEIVCATAGPGLIGAVLVGFCYAKALAIGWRVPFVAVNHLEGHLLSPLLNQPAPPFPFLSLVVSGGHTSLYVARGIGDYEILAQTIDDAAGEAYDKVARMMGLGYPGGPIIDNLAKEGDPRAIDFPRANRLAIGRTKIAPVDRTELDVSFSGLKTAVRNYLEKTQGWVPQDVAASFQAAVIDVLLDRVKRAVQQTGITRIAIGGGVAANSELRNRISGIGLECFIPPRNRCTDNGSMIALVGRLRYLEGFRTDPDQTARSRWKVGTE